MSLKKLVSIISALVFFMLSCSNKNAVRARRSFCDTVCMSYSLKFFDNNNRLHPYVFISAKDCTSDTLTWGYEGQNKNIQFNYKLNKDYTRCLIKDTAFALLVFNTCDNGRGYFMRFSFGKKASFRKSTSAINNFDPRFSVADSLLAYTDKGIETFQNAHAGAIEGFGKICQMDCRVGNDAGVPGQDYFRHTGVLQILPAGKYSNKRPNSFTRVAKTKAIPAGCINL